MNITEEMGQFDPILPNHQNCSVRNKSITEPSCSEYGCLVDAFDYFNHTLLGGNLPSVLITLNQRCRSRGYYCHQRFSLRTVQGAPVPQISEISLNAKAMEGRSDMEILSTVVHEMVHLWQFTFGSPSRSGYHNREWLTRWTASDLPPQTQECLGENGPANK